MAKRSNETVFAELDATFRFLTELEQVAGYVLPQDIGNLLQRVGTICHIASKNESMAPVAEWARWSEVSRGISALGHSLAAAHYHRDNVAQMERRVDKLLATFSTSSKAARVGGHFNPGLTNRFSFEYHAFASVSTRCMNDLSASVGSAWNKRCPHLMSLKKLLSAESGQSHGASLLLHIVQAHRDSLNGMFTQGSQRSIRDWIAHESFLHAGSLHVDGSRSKLTGILSSGFDHVDPSRRNVYRLSEVMTSQLDEYQGFVEKTVVALRDHVVPQIDGGNARFGIPRPEADQEP